MRYLLRAILLGLIGLGIFGSRLFVNSAAVPSPEAVDASRETSIEEPSASVLYGGRFLRTLVDLGQATPYSGELHAAFAVVNDGPGPARLASMTPDCQCARTEFVSSELKEKQGEVCSVFVNPSGKRGRFEVNVQAVFANNTSRPVSLRVVGEVVDLIEPSPRVADLGEFDETRGAAATIALRNTSNAPFKLSVAEFPDQLEVSLRSTDPVPPGGSAMLDIHAPPTNGALPIEEQITLKMDGLEPPVFVSVRGRPYSGVVQAHPAVARFGFVDDVNSSADVEIQLRARDERPFEIVAIDSPALPLDVSWRATGDWEYVLVLKPADSPQRHNPGLVESVARIRMRRGAQDIEALIPLRAFVVRHSDIPEDES